MNINNLSIELKFPNRIGATLSIDQRTNLELAVLKLSQEQPFDQQNFWGRVDGLNRNYYIVQGINQRGKYDFPQKKYFWSSQSFKFAELPQPRSEFSSDALLMRDFFTGQHEKILIQNTKGEKKVVSKLLMYVEHGSEQLVIPPKNFTQLDRLSCVVHNIEEDCQIVPIGAIKILPTHELIKNQGFRGLKIDEAIKPSNYLHFRKPHIHQKTLIISSDQALHRMDFLDSISEDNIKGSWSIQADQSKTHITVRSLLWPGYVGYHRTNSQTYGGVYFGDGVKNNDLPFIL